MKSYRGSFRFLIWLVAIISVMVTGCASNRNNSAVPDDPDLLAEIVSNTPETAKQMEEIEGGELTASMEMQPISGKWTVQDCIAYALQNNEKIQSLDAKSAGIDGEIIQAWSVYLPTAVFKYVRANTKETDDINYYQLAARTMVWDCGKTKTKVKILKSKQAAYQSAKQAEMLEIAYNIKTSFYDLLYARYLVAAKKVEVESAKSNEQNTRGKVEGGLSRESELLATKAAVAEAEQAVFEASNRYGLSKQRLNHYMGRELNEKLDVEGELAFNQIPLDNVHREKLVRRALNDNSSLKQLEEVIQQAEFFKEEARRTNYPDIHAMAFYEYRDTDRELQFADGPERIFDGNAYGIGVEVELPLFRGFGMAYGKNKKADQLLKSSEKDYDNAKREVAYRVQEICNKMQESGRGIHTAQISMEYYDKLLSTVESGMLEGSYKDKDLIEAKKNLANAKVNLMKYILDYNVAKARLDRILGILESN